MQPELHSCWCLEETLKLAFVFHKHIVGLDSGPIVKDLTNKSFQTPFATLRILFFFHIKEGNNKGSHFEDS